MRKERAPDITPERLDQAVDLIDVWRGKLTWELLLDKLEQEVGVRYSRFTLAAYPQVANAFSFRKDALRGTLTRSKSEPRDEKIREAHAKVERAKAKADRLEAENKLLLEQFVVWATNAERCGVTIAQLNKPLPKPPRDQSKGA